MSFMGDFFVSWMILSKKCVIINMSNSLNNEEGELVGKKHFMYTLAVVAIVLTIILISFRSQDPGESLPALVIESTKDIRQYYYDSIPGLIRAEQLGVVKPIHKTFEIPHTDHNLKIDRIWYNSRDAYVFYRVENINEIAY